MCNAIMVAKSNVTHDHDIFANVFFIES
jgi:hypothetical protein